MRRALVIAPNWIGDALMAQPLFTLLKKLHPRIAIDAVAPSWVAPVLERMPEIRDVYATDLAHGKLQLLRRWQLASDLRDVGYDAAYVLPNSMKSALLPWMAGIGLRIGYKGESRYGLLNVRHANPPKTDRPPMTAHYAALAYAPGAKLPFIDKFAQADAAQTSDAPHLPVPRLESDPNEAVRVSARFNLDTRTPLVVFCPGAEYGRPSAGRRSISHRSRSSSRSRFRMRASSHSGRTRIRRSPRPSRNARPMCATYAVRHRLEKRAR